MNRGGQCPAGLWRFVVGYGNVFVHIPSLFAGLCISFLNYEITQILAFGVIAGGLRVPEKFCNVCPLCGV